MSRGGWLLLSAVFAYVGVSVLWTSAVVRSFDADFALWEAEMQVGVTDDV